MQASGARPVSSVVLGAAIYPTSQAATRLRLAQYVPALADAGVELRLWTFFSPADTARWYGPSHVGRVLALLGGILRLPTLLRAAREATVVIVQREVLPVGPPVIEWLLARRRHLIWDVDDSVWVPYVSPTAGRVPQWVRATGNKFERLCRRADEVWAGSEVLAAWCRGRNANVLVVPTVVDVPAERPVGAEGRTVGWVGSHSTASFLESVLPAVARVDPLPELVVVGATPTVPSGLRADVRRWSAENEADALASTRVGLYPIARDHPLAEGKCGLKAILFMAHGIPVITTPTTTNAHIVRHEIDGLHADGAEDWRVGVQRLLDDPGLWEVLSANAHRRALDDFSLAAWAPRIVERLRSRVGVLAVRPPERRLDGLAGPRSTERDVRDDLGDP